MGMTLRRRLFWINLVVNACLVGVNVFALVMNARQGAPTWPQTLVVVALAIAAYAMGVSEDLLSAKLAFRAANQRTAEAHAAMSEDMAAKMKQARVEIEAAMDSRDDAQARRH